MNIKDWENTKKNLMLSEKNSFGDPSQSTLKNVIRFNMVTNLFCYPLKIVIKEVFGLFTKKETRKSKAPSDIVFVS